MYPQNIQHKTADGKSYNFRRLHNTHKTRQWPVYFNALTDTYMVAMTATVTTPMMRSEQDAILCARKKYMHFDMPNWYVHALAILHKITKTGER
jgi:hypothetical protein